MGKLHITNEELTAWEFGSIGLGRRNPRQFFLEKIYEAGGPVKKTKNGYSQAGELVHMEDIRTSDIVFLWPSKKEK